MSLVLLSSVLAGGSQIFADGLNSEDSTGTPNYEPVIEATLPAGSEIEPLGQLSPDELRKHIEDNTKVTPFHVALPVHTHYFDGVVNSYEGYNERGYVTSGENRGPKGVKNNLKFDISHSYGNSWTTSIGFEAGIITTALGYDVTYSTTKTFGYEAEVNGGDRVNIGLKDWYKVTNFKVKTYNYNGAFSGYDYGTGQAKQWLRPEFYSDYVIGGAKK